MFPLLLTVGGCSSKPSDPTMELSKLRDQLCACTNAACADRVQVGVKRWTTQHAKQRGDQPETKELLARVALCQDNATGDPLAREAFMALDDFRNRACACRDAACATAVQNEHSGWLRTNGVRFGEMKATPLQTEEGNRVAAETERCARKALRNVGMSYATPAPPTSP